MRGFRNSALGGVAAIAFTALLVALILTVIVKVVSSDGPVNMGYDWATVTSIAVPDSKSNPRGVVYFRDEHGRKGAYLLPAFSAGIAVGDKYCVHVNSTFSGALVMRPVPESDCAALSQGESDGM